jgi:hypothetical protein
MVNPAGVSEVIPRYSGDVAFGICSRFVFMFAGKIRVNRPKSRLWSLAFIVPTGTTLGITACGS